MPLVRWGKTPLRGIFDSSVFQYRKGVFPNSQLVLRSNFSYSKHYPHWKCINIIQTLCPGLTGTAQNLKTKVADPDSIFQHLVKSGILCLFLPGPLALNPE